VTGVPRPRGLPAEPGAPEPEDLPEQEPPTGECLTAADVISYLSPGALRP
jgi:hypothetical protein